MHHGAVPARVVRAVGGVSVQRTRPVAVRGGGRGSEGVGGGRGPTLLREVAELLLGVGTGGGEASVQRGQRGVRSGGGRGGGGRSVRDLRRGEPRWQGEQQHTCLMRCARATTPGTRCCCSATTQSVAGLVGDVTTFDVSVQDMVQDMSHVVRSCLLNGEWSGVEPPIAGRTTTASASPPLGAWLSRRSKHGSGSGNIAAQCGCAPRPVGGVGTT